MTTIYTKSFSSDFGSSLNTEQFSVEIANEGGIVPKIIRVDRGGDNVKITFDVALSAGEQTTLDTLISNHVPNTVPTDVKNMTYSVVNNKISSTTYNIVGKFTFSGGTYAKLYSVSYMDSPITSYNIKIYDRTNDNIIKETTLSNTTESIETLGIGSNINTGKAIWEIQVKKTGGTDTDDVYIDSIYVEYA